MNILPKKSWHVLSRDNLERVRRDEAEAKRTEEEKAKRATLAEQEARVQFMRQRARADQIKGQYEDLIKGHSTTTTPTTEEGSSLVVGEAGGGVSTESRHINFFADMKTTGVGLEGSVNVEHEREKKQEQETWEKKTGILTYLVDKESGSSSEPWYARKKDKKENKRSHEDRKAMMDPLNDMKGYVEAKRKHLKLEDSSLSSLSQATPSSKTSTAVSLETGATGLLSTHKSKKKKKKKDREEEKRLTMERLRAERKKREESERARSELVMKKHYGLLTEEQTEETSVGKYNNQFNPHLSRTK